MRERSILFNGEMVRAQRAGRKTRTSRVVKPQPTSPWGQEIARFEQASDGLWWPTSNSGKQACFEPISYQCPYGISKDRLWIREIWGAISPREGIACCLEDCEIQYRADLPIGCTDYPGQWPADEARENPDAPRWRPSIHMPRWASRTLLEITEVRVEQVQDIRHEDAVAEGIEIEIWDQAVAAKKYGTKDEWFQEWTSDMPNYVPTDKLTRASFHTLWDFIYAGQGFGWAKNPWVFVIFFKEIDKP